MSRGLSCDNLIRLKWEEEFVADGRAFGREGIWGKGPVGPRRARPRHGEVGTCWPLEYSATLPIEAHHFINVFVRNLEGDVASRSGGCISATHYDPAFDALVSRPRLASRRSPTSPRRLNYHVTLPTSPSLSSHFDGFEPDLFDYYFSRLCPLTTPSRHMTSPFSDLILPLFAAGGQAFAMQSILAFSARHRSLTDPRWSAKALSLKGKALSALRRRIASQDAAGGAIADPQIPIAMVFLCLDEILDNCDHRWVIHMRACQDWLHRRKRLPSSTPDSEQGLISFAERFFASQDVISRTACGNSPHFGLDYWRSLEREADAGSWVGCSPALASVMFRITELGRGRERGGLAADNFERQAASLDEELEALGRGSRYDRQGHQLDSISSIFEMTLEAVKVYHHCLLYDASPSMPTIAAPVANIIHLAHGLVRAGCASGLAFPIFVAAVELDPLNDEIAPPVEGQRSGRRVVLEMLQMLAGSALFNVAKARAVIEEVWAVRDLSLEEERRGTGNDWNVYVSPYSSNISLA